jgi:CheY-like chemotaxis protein
MDNKKTIMVVDDNPDIITIVKTILEGKGYSVLSASSGVELLNLLKSQKPDLIILDIMMPEMDGYQAMRQIREMKEFRTLPLIALTAKAMKGDREKCIEAGASDYIAKPINNAHLLSMLKSWLAP